MAAYPDYSHKAITKAVSVISSHNLLPKATVDDLSAMASKVRCVVVVHKYCVVACAWDQAMSNK